MAAARQLPAVAARDGALARAAGRNTVDETWRYLHSARPPGRSPVRPAARRPARRRSSRPAPVASAGSCRRQADAGRRGPPVAHSAPARPAWSPPAARPPPGPETAAVRVVRPGQGSRWIAGLPGLARQRQVSPTCAIDGQLRSASLTVRTDLQLVSGDVVTPAESGRRKTTPPSPGPEANPGARTTESWRARAAPADQQRFRDVAGRGRRGHQRPARSRWPGPRRETRHRSPVGASARPRRS